MKIKKNMRIVILVVFLCFGMFDLAFAQYHKMMVIGNSLTHHSPLAGADADGLVWDWDWGMAASSEATDFVHVLHSNLQANQLGIPIEIYNYKKHISNERGDGGAGMTGYDDFLNSNADLIIFQLGDNYRGNVTDAEFRIPYETMISDITAGGNSPDVVVLGTWWDKPSLDTLIEQAALNQRATYMPIHQWQTWANCGAGEDYYDPVWGGTGIEWHPGDTGMELIADGIYAQLPVQTPEPFSIAIFSLGGVLFLRGGEN